MNPSTQRIVATTLANLHKEPSFHTELLTQITNGTLLEVVKSEGEWCYVRQTDGYEGWTYAAYLAESSDSFTPAYLVAVPELVLRESPDPNYPVVTRLPIGTAVVTADDKGKWTRIAPAGNSIPAGWALLDDLSPMSMLPLDWHVARQGIIEHARRLTGVHYLWGGTTARGIDCSGLAQLCHRLCGYTIPRDARLQFPVGRVVEGPIRPGDLLFFCGETNRDRITHVGISLGGSGMIHSSRSRNGVYEDDLDAPHNHRLRERLVGARSLLD